MRPSSRKSQPVRGGLRSAKAPPGARPCRQRPRPASGRSPGNPTRSSPSAPSFVHSRKNVAASHRTPIPRTAQGTDALVIAADAPLRLLGHLDLGSQAACCRIPPRALNTGCLSDQTASSVAPDEIFRPQRPAIGQLDVDAGVVLHETRHLTSAIDRHPQLADPAGQRALDVVLPQPEPVVVPSGKVADVQPDAGEPRDLSHLSLREEPIRDSTLIEDLDGA